MPILFTNRVFPLVYNSRHDGLLANASFRRCQIAHLQHGGVYYCIQNDVTCHLMYCKRRRNNMQQDETA